jgi:hypothetical protein
VKIGVDAVTIKRTDGLTGGGGLPSWTDAVVGSFEAETVAGWNAGTELVRTRMEVGGAARVGAAVGKGIAVAASTCVGVAAGVLVAAMKLTGVGVALGALLRAVNAVAVGV